MINRHIDDMSHDAEEILCDKLKNNRFSMQVDEPTYFTNKSYVETYVRYANDGEIKKKTVYVAKSCLKQKRARYI
jgi:hypothetical protein